MLMDFDASFFNRTARLTSGDDVSAQGGVSPGDVPGDVYAVCVQRSANRSNIDRQDSAVGFGGNATLRRSMAYWGVFFQAKPPITEGDRLTLDDGRTLVALGPAADGGDGMFNLWLVECEEVN